MRKLFLVVLLAAGCSPSDPPAVLISDNSLEVGPSGGELVPPEESPWAGISLKIPAGALKSRVTVTLVAADDETPLPDTAERVGPFLSFEPSDTVLEKPAELTVELDPLKVAEFEQTPADCKVWMRDGEGWKRLEQDSSTAGSVTVKLPKLSTVAAGVNASLQNVCLAGVPGSNCQPQLTLTTHVAVNPCVGVTADYCLLSLPQPESTRGIDEFASLVVIGRKVYWVKNTGDNDVTVGRYDLDAPGPVTEFTPLTRAPSGTTSARGRVALDATGRAWAGVGGLGNIAFSLADPPLEFDVQSSGSSVLPLGVLGNSSGSIQRFRRQVISSGKSDVRMALGASNSFEFVFNYPLSPTENIFGMLRPGSSVAVFRSVHRGASIAFDSPVSSDIRAVDFAQGGLGTVLDDDAVLYGAAAFDVAGQQLAAMQGANLEWWNDADDFDPKRRAPDFSFSLPVVPRDLAFGTFNGAFANRVYAIGGGRREVYEVTKGGAMRTLPLPEDTASMTPWRIVPVPGSNDFLLVTRGPLTKKGEFWLLRRLR